MEVLQLHNSKKSFEKKKVINNVSFTLTSGEILGIFGRNGCGKSTLLKMIFGTLSADSINITINEKEIRPSKIIEQKQIAYLPQQSFIPKNLKLREIIIIYFSEEKKLDKIFYDPLIAKLAAKRPCELSLGELRYFEVLLIGNLEHPFLMLDEPFSMIDPLYKAEIKLFLNSIKSEKGIIITDHYFDDVLDIADHNLLIHNGIGKIIQNKKDLIENGYLSKNHS